MSEAYLRAPMRQRRSKDDRWEGLIDKENLSLRADNAAGEGSHSHVVGRGLLIRCEHLDHLISNDHGRLSGRLIQVISRFGTEKKVVVVALDRARLIQVHYIGKNSRRSGGWSA